jgi:amino acid transporter
MYPVSGGTARFPHFAFGSIAGISFGFFSWLQAVTVAPIECFAVMQYGSFYWHGLYDSTTGNVTGLGFAMTVVLLAIFTAINFLAMRLFSKVNAGITWWKVAIPVLTIIVLAFKFHASNLGAGGGFMPYGIKALFAAIPSAGIVFAYLGFEQADQLAGEIKNPQKNLPLAILTATGIGIAHLLPAAAGVHRRDPAQPDQRAQGLGGHPGHQPRRHRAVRRPGGPGRAGLAGRLPADRRLRLPVRHRPDVPDVDLARRLRPGP